MTGVSALQMRTDVEGTWSCSIFSAIYMCVDIYEKGRVRWGAGCTRVRWWGYEGGIVERDTNRNEDKDGEGGRGRDGK